MTGSVAFGMLPRMSARLRCFAWSVCALTLMLAGCTGGTETGNPSITGQLSYTGVSSDPTEIGVRQGGDVATVDAAWFSLDRVTVSAAGDCGIAGDDQFVVDALGIGDHAAGIHNATAFEAVAGAFCSVEVPFVAVPADERAAPVELRGHVVVLTGELADGTPFVIQSDKPALIRLQATGSGFELSSAAADTLIAFDFATWLADVDFASASVEGGQVTLSETSNTNLLRQVEARLANGVALYRDSDGDGVIDVDPELLANAP